jgi:nitronate monooxygenase
MSTTTWPTTNNNRICNLLKINLPILLAPMAGIPGAADLAIAVAEAGGLGSIPCAMLTVDQLRNQWQTIRQKTSRPINLNFFSHKTPQPDPAREAA